MRVDGKFIVNGMIPEGQAAVMQLLEECFDLTYDLGVQAEEEEEEDNDDVENGGNGENGEKNAMRYSDSQKLTA
jgi:hypothetical protein